MISEISVVVDITLDYIDWTIFCDFTKNTGAILVPSGAFKVSPVAPIPIPLVNKHVIEH